MSIRWGNPLQAAICSVHKPVLHYIRQTKCTFWSAGYFGLIVRKHEPVHQIKPQWWLRTDFVLTNTIFRMYVRVINILIISILLSMEFADTDTVYYTSGWYPVTSFLDSLWPKKVQTSHGIHYIMSWHEHLDLGHWLLCSLDAAFKGKGWDEQEVHNKELQYYTILVKPLLITLLS